MKRNFYQKLSLSFSIVSFLLGMVLWINNNNFGIFLTSWIFSISLMTFLIFLGHVFFDLELFDKNYPIIYLLLWMCTISLFNTLLPKIIEKLL